MVCLMMPSFAGATWADMEDNDYTGVTKECLIDMNLEALQDNIEYAISYNVCFNSSAMKFDSEDEELVKQYEKLFSTDKNQEPLYYVNYDFGENVIPVGAKVSVLVRKQGCDVAEETQAAETEASNVQVATPAEASKVESAEASIDVSSNISDSETAQTEHSEAVESESVRTEVHAGTGFVIASEEIRAETTSHANNR